MVNLPNSIRLNIAPLAGSFVNVTNSYKFYWFLSILDHIRKNQTKTIVIDDLLANMIASVWYPTNYFRLSFGKQDRLGQIALNVAAVAGLPMDANKNVIIQYIVSQLKRNSPLGDEIRSLAEYVPYRFLRPFFFRELKGMSDWKVNDSIRELAYGSFDDSSKLSIYRFVSPKTEAIEIQPDWFDYINHNLKILTDFCLWNLVNYLQKNNPNVPNISTKLFEPEHRNLHQAREFWRLVFKYVKNIRCIYSGQMIYEENFSLDHFLPWRFVTHDLLWNIIPTPKSINSAKSDYLPELNMYFESFAKLQFNAVQIISSSQKLNLLEDHIMLLGVSSVGELRGLSFSSIHEKLYETIAPLFQIAKNLGFSDHWIYV